MSWIYNRLTVVGEPDKVQEFKSMAPGRGPIYKDTFDDLYRVGMDDLPYYDFSFNSIISIDDSEKYTYQDYGCKEEMNLWGVKWGPSNVHMDEVNDSKVTYSYLTHSSIGLFFWEEAIACFPNLHFFLSASCEDAMERTRIVMHRNMPSVIWESSPIKIGEEDQADYYQKSYQWMNGYTDPIPHSEWVMTETIKRKVTWKSL